MERGPRMNSRFRHKEVFSSFSKEVNSVGGELNEIVDQFSDGRVEYGCNFYP